MQPWVTVLLCLLTVNQVTSWGPTWNTLRVTWGLQVWRSNVFGKMPLKSSEAENEGYTKINGSCSGKFLGFRYYKDPALVVLYDLNGYIAGVQINYLKRFMTHNMTIDWFKQSKMFAEDVIGTDETYTLTAYLVDPGIICSTGRTAAEFRNSPSGTQLSIQNGSQPLTNLIEVPLSQSNLTGTAWTKGKCFVSMGFHYWYNLTQDMDCNNFKPMFLLYNRGKLTGFGWAGVGNFRNSNRYEHPPKEAFSRFLAPVPTCLNEAYDQVGGFTTMHVYMNTDFWNMACI